MNILPLSTAVTLASFNLVFGQSSGLQSLSTFRSNNVIEVTGIRGQDQPTTWRLTRTEQNGTVMDYFMQNGRVTGSQQANRAPAGYPIALASCRFDSTHAFAKANEAAARSKVGFDSANFRLRNTGRATVWDVQLINHQGETVGQLQISAATGSLLDTRFNARGSSSNNSSYNNNNGGYSNSGYNNDSYDNGYSQDYGNGYNNGYSSGSDRFSDGLSKTGGLLKDGLRLTARGVGSIFNKVAEWAGR